jgi:hypothetical protein
MKRNTALDDRFSFGEASTNGTSTLRDVEFIEMPVRQILNRCDNPALRFRWTINPYRG